MAACHLLRSANPISEETQNPQLNTRKTAAKIVLGLTLVFLISYVPYHVVWSYNISTVEPDTSEPSGILNKFIQHKDYELQYMLIVSTFLLLINACLNPVALFCTSLAFRTHFKRYLTCCFKTNSPSTALELARRS
jgi:amino acid transporter